MLDQPWALTLYSYLQIVERDRISRLKKRDDDVTFAILMAMAMNDPKRLDQERSDVRADMRAEPRRVAAIARVDSIRAAGIALAERIERTGVLDDGV